MKENPDKKNNRGAYLKDYGPYLGLGFQLAITVAAMTFLGVWLDGKFDSSPWLTVIFSFLGVFAALYSFIKEVMKSDK